MWELRGWFRKSAAMAARGPSRVGNWRTDPGGCLPRGVMVLSSDRRLDRLRVEGVGRRDELVLCGNDGDFALAGGGRVAQDAEQG